MRMYPMEISMMKKSAVGLLAALVLTLTGCGQKGALYIPTETSPIIHEDGTVSPNPNDY